jgi:hypothetical protein
MQDMAAHLEKLRIDAEDCALISKFATDIRKRAVRQARRTPGRIGVRSRASIAAKIVGGDRLAVVSPSNVNIF